MPEMMIDIPVNEVVKIIKAMKQEEVETLALLLTEEGSELLERKKNLELKKVKFLTRDEAFNVQR